jgi:hypothetical protein
MEVLPHPGWLICLYKLSLLDRLVKVGLRSWLLVWAQHERLAATAADTGCQVYQLHCVGMFHKDTPRVLARVIATTPLKAATPPRRSSM